MKTIKIATRGSKLALWQANYVSSLLSKLGYESQLNIIRTQGDRVQDRFLHEIGGKGVFVRELEESMLRGETDIAVHSLKDLPAKINPDFTLCAILKRHQSEDAIIFKTGQRETLGIREPWLSKDHFQKAPPLTIASSSLRRQSLFKDLGDHIKLVPVRGNVDTRIRKLEEGDWDALILAAASLERLQLDVDHSLIDLEWFVPCAAQGALAIECLKDHPAADDIKNLSHEKTYRAASTERAILEALGGDCTMPCGIHITSGDNETKVRAVVLNYQGRQARCYRTYSQSITELSQDVIVSDVMDDLREQGVEKILRDINIQIPDLGTIN